MLSLVDSCTCPDQGSNPQPRCIWIMLYPTELPGQGRIAFLFKADILLYGWTDHLFCWSVHLPTNTRLLWTMLLGTWVSVTLVFEAYTLTGPGIRKKWLFSFRKLHNEIVLPLQFWNLAWFVFLTKKPTLPWLGGSVGWSITPIHQEVGGSIPSQGTNLGCGFDPRLGCT